MGVKDAPNPTLRPAWGWVVTEAETDGSSDGEESGSDAITIDGGTP